MKKIFTLIAAVCAVSAMSAQTIQIVKDGTVVAQYDATEGTEVVFLPAETCYTVDDIVGSDLCGLSVTLLEMPDMGVVLSGDGEVTVTANEDGTINITLPSVNYEAMGMTLPSFTVSNMEVTQKDGVFSFDSEFSFVEEETGKEISGSIAGHRSAVEHWDFDYVVTMHYGSMPFTLVMNYYCICD